METVRNLRSGDEPLFSDGRSFTLDEKLGQGSSAVIWSIKGNEQTAIRIPRARSDSFWAMDDYRQGWARMKQIKVPVVPILDFENDSMEYQLVARRKIKFTFWQWVDNYDDPNVYRSKVPKKMAGKALEALERFALRVVMLAELGDGLQMGFDGENWELIDFTDQNFSFVERPKGRDLSKLTVWHEYIHDTKLRDRLIQITLNERERLCLSLLIAPAA